MTARFAGLAASYDAMAELSKQRVQAGILGTAVDAAAAAVFVTDEQGRFVAANKFACRMLGYEREDLLSLRLADIALASDLPSSLESGSAVGIAPLRHRDGTNVTVRYQVRTLNGGAQALAVWVATPRHPRRVSTLEARSARARGLDELSAREIEILQLVADGLENEAIAKELYISTETVKSHVRRIFQKLGAHSRTYAVAVAFRRQLID